MSEPMPSGGPVPRNYGEGINHEPANLGDILERVLDKGLVIAGDIRVSLLDIELLTIKLRLLIASVDTARELGINWWETDPWLRSEQDKLLEENRALRKRVAALEESGGTVAELEQSVDEGEEARSSNRRSESSRQPRKQPSKQSSRRSSDE